MTDEFLRATQRLDELVREFESLPFPQVQAKVFELLQTVDTVHRIALGRLIAFLGQRDRAGLIEAAAGDPVIGTLLQLYDLLPSDELSQVETALAAVRPSIHSHGGEVEVLAVQDGVVHLRLGGACQGCAGSATTLKRGVEAALREGFPGFQRIEVHEPEPAPASSAGFISLDQLRATSPRAPTAGNGLRAAGARPRFQAVARLEEIPPGTLKHVVLEGVHALVANIAGEIYAVRDRCPGSMAPLHLGSFSPPVVVCPWHNEAFDVRTGRRADGMDGPPLEALPVAVVGREVQIAVNSLGRGEERRR